MADKTQMLAEAYRRGLLPPQKAAAYEEAMRRNLVPRVEPRKPGVIEDVGRSFVAGVERGVQGLLSAKGDVIDLGSNAAIDAALRSGLITRQQAAEARKTVTGIRQNRIQIPIVSNVLGNAPTSAELRAGSMVPYDPQTRAGRFGRAVGENLPNALAPGGAVARTANVLAPAIVGEGAAQVAEGMGAGEGGQAAARVVGSIAGGALASVRPNALRPPEQGNALNPMVRTTRQDPNALRARAQEFRDAGIDPTLVDVVDEAGRGTVRAAASRMSPGRQVAQDFAEGRALNLPDRISQQARRLISGDTRAVEDIIDDLVEARSQMASTTYAQPYSQPVQLTDDVLRALSGGPGRAALQRARQAAVARMDDVRVQEIDALLNADAPLPMDEVSRMARATAQGFTVDAYHGTPRGFQGMPEIGRSGQNTGQHARGAIYAADDPAVANTYAAFGDDTAGAVYPLRLRTDGFVDVPPNAFIYDDGAIPQQLRESGAPGMAVRGVRDYAPVPANALRDATDHTTYAAFDPSRVRSRFDAFAPEGYRPPPSEVSGATLDRALIAMRERAQKATRSGARDMASGLNRRAAMIDETLDNVPGLREARGAYHQSSRQIDAARAAEDFTRMNSEDFARAMSGVDDLTPARAVARRAVEKAAGENVAAAPGVARRLATAPEQQARNRALLGPERAQEFEAAMRLEERALRNATDIAPRTGSQTQLRGQDAEAVEGAMRLGGQIMRRDFIGAGMDWLRSRGMNDQQAQLLVEAATDPARLDEAIAYIERAFGPEEARQFLQLRNLGAVTAISAASQSAPAAAEATRSRGQ